MQESRVDNMNYVKIPHTNLSVSQLIIGHIGLFTGDNTEPFKMLDIYREYGGNIIDSANIYGKAALTDPNICDENTGKWLKSRGCRNEFIVVSKGGHPSPDTIQIPRLKKEDVFFDLTETLSAFKTDCIDLYFLHRDDENTPVSYIIEYLNEFVKKVILDILDALTGALNVSSKQINTLKNIIY